MISSWEEIAAGVFLPRNLQKQGKYPLLVIYYNTFTGKL